MIHNLMKGKYAAQHKKEAIQFAANRNLLISNGDFKAGDVIEFWAGYNDDIRYQTEIFGFDKEGNIYVVWDCYWSPIRNDKTRNIKLTTPSVAEMQAISQ